MSRAAWRLVRVELRARATALALIAALAAITTAVALFSISGARLAHAAPDRYVSAAHFPDLAAQFNVAGDTSASQVAGIDGVSEAEVLDMYAVFPEGSSTEDFYPMLGPRPGGVGAPFLAEPLVRGRRPDPRAADEVAVGQSTARRLHVDVGDDLHLSSFTPDGAGSFTGLEEAPDGPRITLQVVGILRQAVDLGGNPTEIALTRLTPAFVAAYDGRIGTFANVVLMSLDRGVDGNQVQLRLEAIHLGVDADDSLGSAQVRNELGPQMDILAWGLIALAVAVGAAGAAMVAQACMRAAASSRGDDGTLRALGLCRSERLFRIGVPLAVAAFAGVVLGAGASIAASPLLPVGLARRLDPPAGLRVDSALLLTALGGGCVVVASLAAGAAALATRQTGSATARMGSLAERVGRLGAPPVITTGLLISRGRRGSSSSSSRSARSAALAAVVGVLAAVTFGASEGHLVSTPRLYGWGWDVVIAPAGNGEVPDGALPTDAVVADPDISAVDLVSHFVPVMAAGNREGLTIVDSLKGHIERVTSSGRDLGGDDELVAGEETLRKLGVHVGDSISVGSEERAAPYRIVGVALFPPSPDGGSVGQGLAMTAAGARRLGIDHCGLELCSDELLIRLRDGAVASEVQARYSDPDAATPLLVRAPSPPSQVTRLQQVNGIPWVLAIFLSLVAAASVTHAIASAVRHRRHEFGVLRALGFDARQLRHVVGTQVIALTLGSCTLGVLGGAIAGRAAWGLVAQSIGVTDEPRVPILAVIVVPLAVVVVAELASIVPRRAASRVVTSEVLRAE